jgi:hypothetical protein
MLLFKVEETFLLTRIGLVLTPGPANNTAKISAKIRLIRPDKTIIDTKISGINFQTNNIVIKDNLKKEDVPIGTEVWLIE